MAENQVAAAAEGSQRVRSHPGATSRLGAVLTGSGGALTALGALGTEMRVARVTTEGTAPVEIDAVMGYAEPAGWALALIGLVLLISTAVRAGIWQARVIPIAGALTVAGLVAWRLGVVDGRAAEIVAAGRERLGFAELSAHFGWGAWSLMVASVLLVLGAVAAALGFEKGGLSAP